MSESPVVSMLSDAQAAMVLTAWRMGYVTLYTTVDVRTAGQLAALGIGRRDGATFTLRKLRK